MGTPDYVVPVPSALLDAGHAVGGVFTQPDRQTGRGKKLTPPPVKLFAAERGIPAFQPLSLRRDPDRSWRQALASLAPDLIVVAAYGLFLPAEVFSLPRLGSLNVHPSLLPRYRGASPVASAILNGDPVTGVTIMQVTEAMDAGPIVAQQQTPIGPDETAGALTARLFQMGAALLVEMLPTWERGEITPQPQDEAQAVLTGRLSREDGRIDWGRPADYIARQVRAYHPWPGAFTYWHGRLLKVLPPVAVADESALPGQVVTLPDGGVGIGAREGVVEARRLQLEGRRAVSASEFVQGHRDFIGSNLGI